MWRSARRSHLRQDGDWPLAAAAVYKSARITMSIGTRCSASTLRRSRHALRHGQAARHIPWPARTPWAQGVPQPCHEVLDGAIPPIAKDITTHYTACATLLDRTESDRGTPLDLLGVRPMGRVESWSLS